MKDLHIPRTAESVAAGHPDKVCDQISDAILDAILERDPSARVAVEVMGGHGSIVAIGEVATQAEVQYKDVIQDVLAGFSYFPKSIDVRISRQSPEIAERVVQGGAGDQGIMVGYASAETPELLPREFVFARRLTRAMGMRDGKSQVTMSGERINRVVVSVCGNPPQELWDELSHMGIEPHDHRLIFNTFEQGGFEADTGLTGRKIVIDAYGPRVPVGGGAFSGKDPSKVDRSGAYMARKIAVDLLRQHNAQEVEVQLAYSIGLAEALMARALITNNDRSEQILPRVEGYDLTPEGIIQRLQLRRPQYLATAKLGHFGNRFIWDTPN